SGGLGNGAPDPERRPGREDAAARGASARAGAGPGGAAAALDQGRRGEGRALVLPDAGRAALAGIANSRLAEIRPRPSRPRQTRGGGSFPFPRSPARRVVPPRDARPHGLAADARGVGFVSTSGDQQSPVGHGSRGGPFARFAPFRRTLGGDV